jgi:hypothetical protein
MDAGSTDHEKDSEMLNVSCEYQELRDALRAMCAEYHRKVDEVRRYTGQFVRALSDADCCPH